jgi:hypothetical protein
MYSKFYIILYLGLAGLSLVSIILVSALILPGPIQSPVRSTHQKAPDGLMCCMIFNSSIVVGRNLPLFAVHYLGGNHQCSYDCRSVNTNGSFTTGKCNQNVGDQRSEMKINYILFL